MKLTIQHQESYSRGELLLRTLFGFIYILIPHMFILYFLMIASAFCTFISWWAILFTGQYPEGMFNFQVNLMRWSLRVNARLSNLSDGYPAFGLNAEDDKTSLDIEYPQSLSRGLLLLKTFFGFIYVGIPHGFILMFRGIGSMFLMFLAWWVVLFTGKYPEGWHAFNVGTTRWQMRVGLYLMLMTDVYPPFTGEEVESYSPEDVA